MLQVPTLLALCLLSPGWDSNQDPEVTDLQVVDPIQDPEGEPEADPEEVDQAGQDPVKPDQAEQDPAEAEQAEVARRLARREWMKLIRRDATVGFTERTRQTALRALGESSTVGISRACAFFALGSVQSVAFRPTLEVEAREAPGMARRAAVLALGELGESLKGGVEILIELLEDPDPTIVNDALLALARSGLASAESHLRRLIADPSQLLAVQAHQALNFTRSPNRPSEFESARMLLSLRYESAKRFGTLNGRPWSHQKIEELTRDEAFLDEVVLIAAAELSRAGIKDHLMEVVVEPGRTLRWRAAAKALPLEVERMVASGLGGPTREAGWAQLVDGAVEAGWASSMPETLTRALGLRSLAPTAAAQLVHRRPELDEKLRAALKSPRRDLRVRAAEAIGRLSLTGYLLDLRELAGETQAQGGTGPRRMPVAAAGWVALLRLGDVTAAEPMTDVLADRVGAYSDSERTIVLDALEKGYRSEVIVRFLLSVVREAQGTVQAEIQALLARSGHGSPWDEFTGEWVVMTEEQRAKYLDPSRDRSQDRWSGTGAGLRAAYGEVDRGSSTAGRLLRGIAHLPGAEDLEFLAREFPLDENHEGNVFLAHTLIRNGHAKVEPILKAAVWDGPWHRSVLAAALVVEYRGVDLLMQWASKPPASARSADLRRVGFAIGEWGGLEAIDALRRHLGSAAGAERPALQGALLGALTTRTH
jgi:HEAT repeat protein